MEDYPVTIIPSKHPQPGFRWIAASCEPQSMPPTYAYMPEHFTRIKHGKGDSPKSALRDLRKHMEER